MVKVLVLILTSSNLYFLEKCYESVCNQIGVQYYYDIKIVVNTLNKEYEKQVIEKYGDKVIVTESNGFPGKGHNSLLTVFEEHKEYDYLINIDGDDFLYPCALKRLGYLLKYEPDMVGLMYNDSLTNKSMVKPSPHYPICDNGCLKYNFNKMTEIEWYKCKLNPFRIPLYNNDTPFRFILRSRNSLHLKYNENMVLYDDYPICLDAFESMLVNKLKLFKLSDSDIYLYNKINEKSASNDHTVDDMRSDDKVFQKLIKNNYLLIRDWNLRAIPTLYLDEEKDFKLNDKVKFCENILRDSKYKAITFDHDKLIHNIILFFKYACENGMKDIALQNFIYLFKKCKDKNIKDEVRMIFKKSFQQKK